MGSAKEMVHEKIAFAFRKDECTHGFLFSTVRMYSSGEVDHNMSAHDRRGQARQGYSARHIIPKIMLKLNYDAINLVLAE